jgi:hypothetical protein
MRVRIPRGRAAADLIVQRNITPQAHTGIDSQRQSESPNEVPPGSNTPLTSGTVRSDSQ